MHDNNIIALIILGYGIAAGGGYLLGAASPPTPPTSYTVDPAICRMVLLNEQYEKQLKQKNYIPPTE